MELIGSLQKPEAVEYESFLKTDKCSISKRINEWVHEALEIALADSTLNSSTPFPRYTTLYFILSIHTQLRPLLTALILTY